MGRPAAGCALLLLLTQLGCHHQPAPQETLRSAALDLLLRTEAVFYRDDRRMTDRVLDAIPSTQPADGRAAATHLLALAAAARVDPFWKRRLQEYADALIDPTPEDTDAALRVIALLHAHETTRNPAHLSAARAIADRALVISNQHTPEAMLALLRVYRHSGDTRHLSAAEKISETIDPTDELRPESPDLAAAYIEARCAWFDITDNIDHLGVARRTAWSVVSRWTDRRVGITHGTILSDAPSAAALVEALFELYRRDGDERWHAAASAGARALRRADPNGWRPERSDARPSRPLREIRLIDQSSAVRAMLMADIVR